MWQKIIITKSQIEYESAKAVLIKMPNKSKYAGYKFWHTKKLVRNEAHLLSVSFNETFTFEIFENGKGAHNRNDVIDRQVILADEMYDIFENQTNAGSQTLHSMK